MKSSKTISIIISDIEGCISPNKGEPLALDALAQIQGHNRLAESGKAPPLTLCSGRSQPFVEAFAQMLAVTQPCICENGAVLYDPPTDRLLRHPGITDETIRNLKELYSLLENEIQVKSPHRVEPGKEICISLNPVADPKDYHKYLKELFEYVSQYVDTRLFSIVHSASAVDITPKGIDKAAGVRFLSEITDIPLQQMLGIGDSPGDLPLLRLVGYSAAPANASRIVCGEVTYVSTYAHAYGLVDIISKATTLSKLGK